MYLDLLSRAARKYEVAVHGYVLMTTHTHAILTGHHELSLPRMMQALGKGYVRYFNRRYRRSGTLWEGRYRASLIGTSDYWLTCLRYVEMNPVAAQMVVSPADYSWSSYPAHARGGSDPLLTPHPLLLGLGHDGASRAAAWAAFCSQPIDEADLVAIRRATRHGLLLSADLGQGDEPRRDRAEEPAASPPPAAPAGTSEAYPAV